MIFIADFYAGDILGGGELCSEEIIKYLEETGVAITRLHSHEVNNNLLKLHSEETIIVSNFMNLASSCKQELPSGKYNYFIIEHDHKYCKSRNPLTYPNMVVPDEEVINLDFYAAARGVLCQSKSHAEILQGNIGTSNVVNLGCNLWSDRDLEALRKRLNQPKTRKIGVMSSPNPIKGTLKAIEFCEIKGLRAELIHQSGQLEFWDNLSNTETIVFLPQSFETYSRFAIEAKILGCKMITNKAIGAMSEDYYHLNGEELLNTIVAKKAQVLEKIVAMFKTGQPLDPLQNKKVSLITTIYKGEKFIQGYLEAFKEQTYNDKELIIVDAASPENEQAIVNDFKNKNPNLEITYLRLEEKVSTAIAFNMATKIASGDFISTVMIDDRMAPFYMATLAKQLVLDKAVDLVYADTFVTPVENEKFDPTLTLPLCEYSLIPFSKEAMIKNIQGPLPMYRKTAHESIGGYNEHILHGTDWDFAIRMVKNNSVFRKVNKVVGSYYNNPNGLSTSADPQITKERRQSERKIFEEHKDLFPENYKKFKAYFEQWKE